MAKEHRGIKRRHLGSWLLLLLFVWGVYRTALFYQTHWSSVVRLPSIVRSYVARHHGQWVTLGQVSPWLPKALVATEDRTFYTNLGISVRGIARSLWVDLATGRFTEGGSTLTQQLVRDQLLGFQKTVRRKLSEALLALAVTAVYPKSEILTLYVNEVYLGQGAYGVGRASQIYFGERASRLSLGQAALLAGLPQAPSYLDPFVHLNAARRRQWEVLQSMVATETITERQAQQAYRAPLGLHRP